MNIDYDDMRSNHKSLVKPILEAYKYLFPSWVDTVVVSYDLDADGGASAVPYRPYKMTTIMLSHELLGMEKRLLEAYILHEIAHCYNEGILRVMHEYTILLPIEDDVRELFNKVMLDAVEYQTEDLARLFGGIPNE
jgi:hypothetical protein